jgi:mono/diheme cytochrome c family protein
MTPALHTALRAAAILIGIAANPAGPAPAKAAEALANPLLGNAEAQAEGLRLYRTRCYICHLHEGGRGPNLFATKLTDEQFLNVVIQGRATLPAFGLRMSPDDVWAVHAYVKSTGKYQ